MYIYIYVHIYVYIYICTYIYIYISHISLHLEHKWCCLHVAEGRGVMAEAAPVRLKTSNPGFQSRIIHTWPFDAIHQSPGQWDLEMQWYFRHQLPQRQRRLSPSRKKHRRDEHVNTCVVKGI